MLLRSSVISAVFALSAAVGCGPVYTEVDFEPLSEAGAASSAAAVGGGAAGQAGSVASGGAAAGAAGVHSGAAPTAVGGAGGSAGAGGGSGAGGADGNRCSALLGWQLGPYQLGQRVLSTCVPPYNGTCPANETHEFECQPPTGAVGLGWCSDRQPGVVNGWGEAWLMLGVCPVAH